MPSVYAHYRFGTEVLSMLPEKAQFYAAQYPELYEIGLQGPDILFFYHPFYHNYVNRLGCQIHEWKGRKFFQSACRIIRGRKNKAPFLAYICGVACHYALDLVCHPYILQLVKTRHLNHSSIEGSFERKLIVEDHLPLNTLVTGSIHPTKQNAAVICNFYGRTTGKQILSALRVMVWCNDALRIREDHIIKKVLFFILRLVGKYDSIAGMVITPEANPAFAESDIRLRDYYEQAKPVARKLVAELFTHLESGKRLSKQFDATFSGHAS